MSLFDNLGSALGGALSGQQGGQEGGIAGLLGGLLQSGGAGQSGNLVGALLGGGDIAKTLEGLAANGLGDQVASWLSNNPNLPITPDQLRSALGSEQVQQMAAATGLPVGDFLTHLAAHLPLAASASAGVSAT